MGSRRILLNFLCSVRGIIPPKCVWLSGTVCLVNLNPCCQIIQSLCIYILQSTNLDTRISCPVCEHDTFNCVWSALQLFEKSRNRPGSISLQQCMCGLVLKFPWFNDYAYFLNVPSPLVGANFFQLTLKQVSCPYYSVFHALSVIVLRLRIILI